MDSVSIQTLMSSVSEEYETPLDFYNKLSQRYGPFDLDPAATAANAKAPKFYTKVDDGLAQSWFGSVYVNPPYGRDISRWIQKAITEVYSVGSCDRVVMLLPARTDTKWFHELVWDNADKILFVKGRLNFVGASSSAPFPSIVAVFQGRLPTRNMDRIGVIDA